MSPAALMDRSGPLKGRRMKAEKRVAIPKAMGAKKVGAEEEDAKLTLATHLVDQCARAQLQMQEAMSEMCQAKEQHYFCP